MPIYEYHCSACGQNCELLQKFTDAPATICPHCEKPTLEKQISAAAFHLKGSGWYVTDFKDKKKTADSDSTPKADTKPETSSDEKTPKKETKPPEKEA